ncbi:DUF1499 domain-containing protein [Sphingobium cyanobacteriorum]|nr:DUF1499 domain-containing protein [Sphingobium sp. HBC34]
MTRSIWAERLSKLSIGLGIGAIAFAFAGLSLARYDLVGKLAGFSALLGGGAIALLGLLAGAIALVVGRRQTWRGRRSALIGLVLSLIFVGFLVSRPLAAGKAPAIHDITTDLANPPQFEVLTLRSDNLTGVGTLENWRSVHRAAYGDLKPLTIAKPVAAVTADATRIARDMGWAIAVSDPVRGHIEATASVSYIRFHDDVVIRISAAPDGKGSVVDMRSVSRVGVGDLGVNARRIRSFLKALAAA